MGIASCAASDKTSRGEATATSRQALATSNGLFQNGLFQNGLSTNGLFQNGLFQNGLFQNGLFQNGLFQNGLFQNGLFQNGLFQNGLFQNGVIQNGLFQNGLFQNGLPGSPGYKVGSPGYVLQQSPNLRQLLQYVFACAMPPASSNPDGGAPISYDTTLDPNSGMLACGPPAPCDAGSTCSSQGTCDVGYTCSAQGTCVIPLTGAIGLGINKDGTHWWDPPAAGDAGTSEAGASEAGTRDGGTSEAGTCDESCQRWVSACVLARTNAYGVHVEISMRAPHPPTVPQGRESQFAQIQAALAPSPDGVEAATYTLREGGYYGNIFATTPGTLDSSGQFVPMTPPQPDGTSAPVYMETPTYNACAGPGSNIPEITKRFCSSQGDQVVINVTGVCETTGVCDGIDDPTTGAMYGCNTSDGTHYDEVITVYLKTPIAVCGNAVCEAGENATDSPSYCPSDCHPGTWAKDIAPNIEQNVVNHNSSSVTSVVAGMSAVAPRECASDSGPCDDPVVVAGTAQGDIDLGRGTLSAILGVGVLAKYHSDGTPAWSVRFGNTAAAPLEAGSNADASTSGAQLQEVNGVTVASRGSSKGNITVVGLAVDANSVQYIWISTFTAAGVQLGPWILPNESGATLQATRAFAVDSQGNIVLAGAYTGTATFGSTQFTSDPSVSNAPGTFVAKISPPGPDAGLSAPAVVWAQSLEGPTPGSLDSFPLSLVVDSADNIVLLDHERTNNDTDHLDVFMRKLSPNGSTELWTHELGTDTGVGSFFSAAAVDANDNVYATGFGYGQDFGNVAMTVAGTGPSPFIVKYDTNGAFQWVSYANTICSLSGADCASSISRVPPPGGVEGVSIGFDPAGNVVLASFGDPAVGGGINFGGAVDPASDASVGTFPTFPTFPTYHSNNIFVAAYSPDVGTLRWAKQIPTILSSNLLGMAVDSQGRIVVSGNYSGSMQVDGQLLVTPVPQNPNVIDSFLASFGGPPPHDTIPPVVGAGSGPSGSPIFTVPNKIFAQATSSAGAVVFFMPPTSIDTGNAGTSVVCTPPPNTTFPIGTTTVTCTASDPLGNQSNASFTVTVADTLPPLFSPFAELTVQATSASGAAVPYAPTAIDQVDGSITPVCTPASGSVLPVGKTTVTCTANDKSGNQSQTSFVVNVTAPADTTPPSISVPAPMTVSATSASGAVVSYSASATDDVGVAAFACSPASGGVFALGTTAVTCSASDAAGNTANASFTVTVADRTPPSLTVPPSITAEATGPSGAAVVYTASATDNVDGAVVPKCLPASDSVFALGPTPVTCSASDAAGNTASKSFTVNVVDTTPPVLAVPSNLTAAANGPSGAVVTFSASATDLVDGTDPVTCSPASGSTFAIGATTVTCTTTDAHGNTSSKTFTVTVVDTTPPVLTLPGTITATATSVNGATVTYSASATDVVDGSITPACTPASGSTFPLGTTSVSCTASDSHGNKATGSFQVQVQYAWSGILQPVNADGSSVFKLGTTVPVKFQLTGASAAITNAVATLTLAKISSNVTGTDVEAVSTSAATTGNAFRYDLTSGQYIFNLATGGLSKGTWRLSINLQDGVSRTVTISLK